jgi:hypothetical protein
MKKICQDIHCVAGWAYRCHQLCPCWQMNQNQINQSVFSAAFLSQLVSFCMELPRSQPAAGGTLCL